MRAKEVKLAIVGSDTLLGHEIKDVIEARSMPAIIEGYAANGEANFGEEEGEPVVRAAFDAAAVARADVVVFAGSEQGAAKTIELIRQSATPVRVIDCTSLLDQQPEARIAAPQIELNPAKRDRLVVLAHPASVTLAQVFSRLAAYAPIQRSVINIFEPASERGRIGIGELQQQTTSLLSFRPLEKTVFDTQVSFNLLPGYGEQAKVQLASVEQRIELHLATLLARTAGAKQTMPMPSIRLVQAPVFHGYSISAWVELGINVEADAVEQALASSGIEIRGAGQEFPNNVDTAGQSGVVAGDIRVDRNNARAVWLWIVFDNLRVLADGVAELLSPADGGRQ